MKAYKKTNTIEIFSVGGYSTWCYYSPCNIAFDCGEGFTTYMRNRVYAVDTIVLSHFHKDHIGSLVNFIGCRASARGDKEKPLHIHYLGNVGNAKQYIDFIMANFFSNLPFEIKWHNHGACLKDVGRLIYSGPIGSNKTLHIYVGKHGNIPVLHSLITEERSRLKPMFSKYSREEIKRAVENNVVVNEPYTANLLAYLLDSSEIDNTLLIDTHTAIMDCTFLKPEDRDDPKHLALSECLYAARDCGVKNLVVAHVSSRYNDNQIAKTVDALGNDYVALVPCFHNHLPCNNL